MQVHQGFSLCRSKEWTRKCVLPWLIPTYLFIGSFAAHAIIDLLENHLSFARHLTDVDGSNDNGTRPYWTSHKHVASDDRIVTDTATLTDGVEIDSDVETDSAPPFSILPATSALSTRFCIERAPPTTNNSHSALVV